MKLYKIQISNFRSIRDRVELREFDHKLFTFVGANNLGKSNILRALNLFFNGEVEPGMPFDPHVDLSQGARNAVIAITFEFSTHADRRMTSYIDKHYKADFPNHVVPITLSCENTGRLQFSFLGEKGQRKTVPELLGRIRDYVNCIYVPSIKDYRSILDQDMMRKIVGATFQGWGKGRYGSKTIGEQKEKFRKLLSDVQLVLAGC